MIELQINEFGYSEQNIVLKNLKYVIADRKCVINGPNGVGKTTLSLLLSGIIPHLHKCHFDGSLIYNGKQVTIDTLKSKFYYQFQNPSFNFLSLRVSDLLTPEEFKNSFSVLFPESTITLDQSLSLLSVGQKQQLAFYDAIRSDKEVVFFDEPFSFMDSKSIASSISAINNNSTKTFVLVNHFSSLTEKIEHRSTISLGSNDEHKIISFDKNEFLCNDVLFYVNCSNFHVQWHKIKLPRDFSINKGEILGISGDNGSGKTTLARGLAGLIDCNLTISYKGTPINRRRQRETTKLAFQDVDYQIFQNDIRKELAIVLQNHYDIDAVEVRTKEFDKYFSHINEVDPFKLSYGQRKLFVLLLMYLLEPELWILDEPFSSLDNQNAEIVNTLIKEHLRKGRAIVLTSHDDNILQTYCNTIVSI